MNDKIDHLNEQRRKKKPQSSQDAIKGAIKRARQHIRNLDIEDLDEPEALASGGDMNEFAKDPDAYDQKEREKEEKDDRN